MSEENERKDWKALFQVYLEKRIKEEAVSFFAKKLLQTAYYIGAYSKAVINSSFYSEVSRENQSFKLWLSNQRISAKNLKRIFSKALEYENKLKLNIRSGIRALALEIPLEESKGISNSDVTWAFMAGFEDYAQFQEDYPSEKNNTKNVDKKGEENE